MKSRKLFKVCALLMLAVMSCLLFSGCGGQSEQKKFVITYLPNESTDKNADARTKGDTDKVRGQRQLHMFDIGGELPGQGRETWQVEVDGHRPEGTQGAENQQDA